MNEDDKKPEFETRQHLLGTASPNVAQHFGQVVSAESPGSPAELRHVILTARRDHQVDAEFKAGWPPEVFWTRAHGFRLPSSSPAPPPVYTVDNWLKVPCRFVGWRYDQDGRSLAKMLRITWIVRALPEGVYPEQWHGQGVLRAFVKAHGQDVLDELDQLDYFDLTESAAL